MEWMVLPLLPLEDTCARGKGSSWAVFISSVLGKGPLLSSPSKGPARWKQPIIAQENLSEATNVSCCSGRFSILVKITARVLLCQRRLKQSNAFLLASPTWAQGKRFGSCPEPTSIQSHPSGSSTLMSLSGTISIRNHPSESSTQPKLLSYPRASVSTRKALSGEFPLLFHRHISNAISANLEIDCEPWSSTTLQVLYNSGSRDNPTSKRAAMNKDVFLSI